MISEAIFKRDLEAAVAFANGTVAEDDPLHRLRWSGGEPLRANWRKFLSTLVAEATTAAQLRRLQDQCVRWAVDAEAADEKAFNPSSDSYPPIMFDGEGRPQMLIFPMSAVGCLALVGAELLAPGAAYGVRLCAAAGCNHFFVVSLRRRNRGRPRQVCDRQDEQRHTSTPRVVRWRNKHG